MKRTTLTAICLMALSAPAVAHESTEHQKNVTQSHRIELSCYRGPFKDVIWDRAYPNFVASLESYGYPRYQAQLMADSICRDPSFIDNPDAMKTSVIEMIKQTPPSKFQ